MSDIREILRRLHLGQGEPAIARDLGVSRKTVRRYRVWATTHDLLTGPVPERTSPWAWTTLGSCFWASSMASASDTDRCWAVARAGARAATKTRPSPGNASAPSCSE